MEKLEKYLRWALKMDRRITGLSCERGATKEEVKEKGGKEGMRI